MQRTEEDLGDLDRKLATGESIQVRVSMDEQGIAQWTDREGTDIDGQAEGKADLDAESVKGTVRRAIEEQLRKSGYRVLPDTHRADFILDAEVKTLNLATSRTSFTKTGGTRAGWVEVGYALHRTGETRALAEGEESSWTCFYESDVEREDAMGDVFLASAPEPRYVAIQFTTLQFMEKAQPAIAAAAPVPSRTETATANPAVELEVTAAQFEVAALPPADELRRP
jgi:hypothetical protein